MTSDCYESAELAFFRCHVLMHKYLPSIAPPPQPPLSSGSCLRQTIPSSCACSPTSLPVWRSSDIIRIPLPCPFFPRPLCPRTQKKQRSMKTGEGVAVKWVWLRVSSDSSNIKDGDHLSLSCIEHCMYCTPYLYISKEVLRKATM